MKLFAAAVIGATLLGTAAVSAQSIELNVGPGRDRVYSDRNYYRDRDFRDSRAYYRDGRDGETVIIKKKKRIYREPAVTIERY